MRICLVLIATAVSTILLFPTEENIVVKEEYSPLPKVVIARSVVEDIIMDTAIRYDIDVKRFLEVAKCESSLHPGVIGDNGESVGVFQIHLVSHVDVSKEDALNPLWAAEWSAKKFKENPYIWTCYNKLYGRNR